MPSYCPAPAVKLRRESWGGLVVLPGKRLVMIVGEDAFALFAEFRPTFYAQGQLPEMVAGLVQRGLVVETADGETSDSHMQNHQRPD